LRGFQASGWTASRVDGHEPEAITAAIERARNNDRPSLIACSTVIGFGAPNRQGTEKAHGAPLGVEEVAKTRIALDWPYEPFQLPAHVAEQWRKIGARGQVARCSWIERTRRLNTVPRSPFHDALNRKLPCEYAAAIDQLRHRFSAERPIIATRQASQLVIDAIAEALPNLLGGSADLTHSNLTRAKTQRPVQPDAFDGTYIHYGHPRTRNGRGDERHRVAWRFHSLRRDVPYLCRLQPAGDQAGGVDGIRVIHVMTHDSIGLGEDGPTHQPVEHLTSLRAIPNLLVFRPGDAIETTEAWDCALRAEANPSVLCLSRQALPAFS